ncbi:MAG: PASTA domain-containing protein [Clostridia bacterium]|nr:PASTA domain-containing protein [Clostridia bacterium]
MFKKWLFAHLLLFAVAFVVADALFGIVAPRGETFTVPDFAGMREADVLADDRLAVTSEYRYDDAPSGTVIGQEPPVGAARLIGGKAGKCAVRLVVSMGQETAEIPDVSGENAHVAAARLREAGFAVELVAVPAGSEEEGTVLSVSPAAGSRLRVGETVRVEVARVTTDAPEAVPNLVGASRDEAVLTLLLRGFSVGAVTEAPSNTPVGTVIRQFPSAGSPLPEKTEVSFVVSLGPTT